MCIGLAVALLLPVLRGDLANAAAISRIVAALGSAFAFLGSSWLIWPPPVLVANAQGVRLYSTWIPGWERLALKWDDIRDISVEQRTVSSGEAPETITLLFARCANLPAAKSNLSPRYCREIADITPQLCDPEILTWHLMSPSVSAEALVRMIQRARANAA